MSKIFAFLRSEPAMVIAALNAGLAWLTTQGFNLDPTTTALVWSVAAAVFGVAVRQQVTPTRG